MLWLSSDLSSPWFSSPRSFNIEAEVVLRPSAKNHIDFLCHCLAWAQSPLGHHVVLGPGKKITLHAMLPTHGLCDHLEPWPLVSLSHCASLFPHDSRPPHPSLSRWLHDLFLHLINASAPVSFSLAPAWPLPSCCPHRFFLLYIGSAPLVSLPHRNLLPLCPPLIQHGGGSRAISRRG